MTQRDLTSINLSTATYLKKLQGCWIGKNIGGTLGGPWEGQRGPLHLSFYDPVPAEPMPNDDLDLQIVWLRALQKADRFDVSVLEQAWVDHVTFPFDEYGISLRNASRGLRGAQRGAYDNPFAECMGAAIRTEIWASLAPGNPERAAWLAWQDASLDHAGDGIWAAVFIAGLESLAFIESDPDILLDRALAPLPSSSRVQKAVNMVRESFATGHSPSTARKKVIEAFDTGNFTDVAINMAFTVLGWLWEPKDFGKAICLATNCGYDTDCTAATLGALLGILQPESIQENWIQPIGETIILSKEIIGILPPATISVLCEELDHLRQRLPEDAPPLPPTLSAEPLSLSDSHFLIPARRAEGSGFPPSDTTDLEHPTHLAGCWTVESLSPDTEWVSYLFELEVSSPGTYLFFAHHQGACSIYVNGEKIHFYAALNEKTRHFLTAASPHRACETGVSLTLTPDRPYHFRIVLHGFESCTLDWVFGIADAKTYQWVDPVYHSLFTPKTEN